MSAVSEQIRTHLFEMQDSKYGDFCAKLTPSLSRDAIIGVRVPQLRAYAKQAADDLRIEEFLSDLPHRYYEENNVHAAILQQMKDYEACLYEVERFLPYVDNWATCDMLRPKVFGRHTQELLEPIGCWIDSGYTYTVRFAIGMLMSFYLDEHFKTEYLEMVASVRSDEYYIRMMAAWYFATALAKQYDAALPYMERQRLDPWTHNKAIQKACESYRVAEEHKRHLKMLKV